MLLAYSLAFTSTMRTLFKRYPPGQYVYGIRTDGDDAMCKMCVYKLQDATDTKPALVNWWPVFPVVNCQDIVEEQLAAEFATANGQASAADTAAATDTFSPSYDVLSLTTRPPASPTQQDIKGCDVRKLKSIITIRNNSTTKNNTKNIVEPKRKTKKVTFSDLLNVRLIDKCPP
jgi:hypothetical protein